MPIPYSIGGCVGKCSPPPICGMIRELGWTAATSEVAAELDASRNTISKKLRAMEAEGDVTSRMAGGIRVWSVCEDCRD